jgi:hypothetical protein
LLAVRIADDAEIGRGDHPSVKEGSICICISALSRHFTWR